MVVTFFNFVPFCVLIQVVASPSGLQSPRDRLQTMAFDLAQRYSSARFTVLFDNKVRILLLLFW